MKMITVYLAVVVGLWALPATYAQSRQISGSGVTPLTPQATALFKETCQLRYDAGKAMDAGKYTIAEATARKAIALGSMGDLCHPILAAALYAQGKNNEALAEYKVLADAGASQPHDLLPYALLLLTNGRYPQAVAAYNKALPLISFGDLVRAKGEFAANVAQPAELETAIHIALGLTWVGGSFWDAAPKYDRALDQFQQALQLSPNDALANLYKGDVLKRLGYKAQARDAYAKAAQFGEGDVRKAAEDAVAKWQYTP